MPPHRLPMKKAYDTRIPLSHIRHFERKREIFFVRGQAKDVRIAASWKHRASSESEGRCFMQTALRKKTETGNEKDPSAALGMTKRRNASSRFFHSATEANLRPLRGTSFQRKEGECRLPYSKDFHPHRHFERMREIFFVPFSPAPSLSLLGEAPPPSFRDTVFPVPCCQTLSVLPPTKKIPRLRSG